MLKCFLIRLGPGHTPLKDSISHSVICKFIYLHWLDIVLALVLITFFSILISYLASRPNGIVSKLIYGLVIEAEKDLGSKTGQLKKKQVISKVYSQLPVFIRFVVNEATVSRLIDEAVHCMKESLEQNNSNLSSLSEETTCSELTTINDESNYNEVNNDEEAKG